MSRRPLFKYGEDILTVQKVMGIVDGTLSTTISKTARVRIIESRKKPNLLPPEPFLSIGAKAKLFYERLRAKSEI